MNTEIESILLKLQNNKIEFLNLIRDWDEDKLRFKPDEESWNVLQVMEHVINSEFGTLAYMKKKTLAEADDIPVATEENKYASSELNKALISDKKWKAPAVLRPPTGEKSREDMVEFWNGISARLIKFSEELSDDYYDKQVFKHPIAGRLNFQQTLTFLSNHVAHHIHQIKRISESMSDD